MNRQEFLIKAVESLGGEGETPELTALEDIGDGWDSIGQLGIVALIDESTGATLDPEKLQACKTLKDLGELFDNLRLSLKAN